MRTASAAWLAAAKRDATVGRLSASYEPIFLVELLGVNRHFATRQFVPTGPRTFGDGLLFGSGVRFGDEHSAYELDLVENGMQEWHVELDETDNAVRLSGTQLDLLSDTALLASFADVVLDQCAVRIRLGFVGLGHSEYLAMWRGVIDRTQDQDLRLNLDLIDGGLRKHRNLSVAIGGQYFPGAPQASRNSHIPILLGVNVDAPAIQIAGDASGTLAFDLSSGSDELYLTEYGAPFPSTGTISIGSETGVTYAARQQFPLQGKTYLRLSGLTRGAPAAHTVGEAVTLTSVQYQYLIGYQVSSGQTVRNLGAVVDPVDYVLSTLQADRPVSILTFTTQQDEVTIDVNAANIDDTNLLTNGGFETGDLTGWTVGSGSTAVVGTSSPTPDEGTYRVALTGSVGTYRDLYQEWPTIPGEDYFLELAYQNQDANILGSNAGFELGDLTDYTQVDHGGLAVYAVIQNQLASADGQYYLEVRPASGQGVIVGELYFDVTVTAGLPYVFSFAHQTFAVNQLLSGGVGTQAGQITLTTQLGYSFGTPADPVAYAPLLFAPAAFTTFTLATSQPGAYGRHTAAIVTPTSTTLRITLHCIGLEGIYGTRAIPSLPIRLDALRLQQASVVDTSQAAYQLGTPTTPGAYSSVDLPLSYRWARTQGSFRATSTTARLTLRSTYAATPVASYFDAVTLRRAFTIHAGSGGQNPVEAMAYIIDTFLPQCTRDTASFTAAYARLLDWKFGAVLTDPGDSRALLQRMAQQCNSLLFEDADGVYKVVVRDEERSVVYGFEASNIVEDTFRPLSESSDNVVTSVYVWYGARTGGGTTPADFQGVTYATPTETTHPSGDALIAHCAGALAAYRREQRLDVFADFVVDLHTANLLLPRLVEDRTKRHQLITFATWLDAAPLELGDVVSVRDPRNAASGPVECEVVSIGSAPNDPVIQVTARTLAQAGWSAAFDYTITLLSSGGWSATFEYNPSVTTGPGWYAEFDMLEPLFATHETPQPWLTRAGQQRRRPPGGSVQPL